MAGNGSQSFSEIFSHENVMSMFGFITGEDRQRWEAESPAGKRKAAVQADANSGKKSLSSHAADSAMNVGKMSMQSQMTAEQQAERERARREDEIEVTTTEKRTKYRLRTAADDKPGRGDDFEMG